MIELANKQELFGFLVVVNIAGLSSGYMNYSKSSFDYMYYTDFQIPIYVYDFMCMYIYTNTLTNITFVYYSYIW